LGLVIPALRWLYDYAWFVGFLTAGALHLALMQSARRRGGTSRADPYQNR
jgi:nucleobase:cation symporter-1, NCS1 family